MTEFDMHNYFKQEDWLQPTFSIQLALSFSVAILVFFLNLDMVYSGTEYG